MGGIAAAAALPPQQVPGSASGYPVGPFLKASSARTTVTVSAIKRPHCLPAAVCGPPLARWSPTWQSECRQVPPPSFALRLTDTPRDCL